jgi:hypothetical protein
LADREASFGVDLGEPGPRLEDKCRERHARRSGGQPEETDPCGA